jgi:hypothetical protein
MKIRTHTQKYQANSHSIKTVMGVALEGHVCMYKTPLGNLIVLREEIYSRVKGRPVLLFATGVVVGYLVALVFNLLLGSR